MNIGILYPRSTAHPSISMEFMDGFKSFLKQHRLSAAININAESAGFGGVEKEVKEKIEKLLLVDDAEVLVLYIDLKIFAMVKPMLEATGRLVIIINPGADYPQSWEPSPNIIHLNLNHAFLCWLTGQLAAEKNEMYAAMATSFYDCGYLHSAMMVSNFNIHGGSIIFNYVNNQAYKEGFHINELTAYLTQDKTTRKLLCIYDELPAALVYHALNQLEDADELQLYVSPMMLQEKALDNNDSAFKFSITGYMPWMVSLQNEANKIFTEKILESTGKAASIFSLLGWEAGMILQQVIGTSIHLRNGNSIVEYLFNAAPASPRGYLILDKKTHWYLSPSVKRIIKNSSREIENEIVQNDIKAWQGYLNNPPRGVVSGWTNTYLCY